MTTASAPSKRCARYQSESPPLRPLVLALLSAFPLLGAAAPPAIVRPGVPLPSAVPRPMPGWRVLGTGAGAPVNLPNAKGGIDQKVNQTSSSAIYNWQSFDIGAASSVTFNLPTQASSALNRVTGSTAPSQIFGNLTSQYANPDSSKPPLVGGSVYLVNANGILFGRHSQVNVGSLIASTLDLKDSDYLGNLTPSIAGKGATFSYGPGAVPSLFTDESNYVVVDPGATITTASGGRVFLFAKNVQNAGTITAPEGQVALAGGGSVYLQDPTAEKLYASEANSNYPVVRGLLVEVGAGPGGGNGSASNLAEGVIATARGNTTLVGMAVNQLGRINATTSVTQNGSVFLLARGAAVDGLTSEIANTKRATASGALTLGAGSSIEIAPDTALGADGKPAVSDGNSTFTSSRIEMAGKTIELKAGSSVVAHGGVVNARAEATPDYRDKSSPNYTAFDGNDATRIVVADGATIDVSGTTTASVSAARNYVTTQLIGKSDLKDAPLQKDGPLYRSKVTFDLRSSVPILGDTSTYQAAIARDATERLAVGGSLTLSSTGAVVTGAASMLDVAGGQVNYTAATAVPTRLVAADGTRYTLDKAPKDILYTSIEGASRTATQDRWGIVPQYVPSQTVTGVAVPGYVDGQSGGTLSIAAPHSILDGRIAAQTVAGIRQTAGQDSLAPGASVNLGSRVNVAPGGLSFSFGDTAFVTAGLRNLTVTRNDAFLPSAFWSKPLSTAVPQTSRIASANLAASGLGQFVVTADGAITVEPGAELSLAPASTVDLAAGGSAGISLGADIHAQGGKIVARTRDMGGQAVVGPTRAGAITLKPGAAIDVSAGFVNRALDGPTAAAATAGGSVTLSSARGLVLEDASRIDVSGGATVAASGAVAGTAAGSITLESDQKRAGADAASRIHLGADLVAQSLVGGGTLALHGLDAVTVSSQSSPRGVKDGLTPGSLQLSPAFFDHAFTNYDIQVDSSLVVQPSVALDLVAQNSALTAAASQAASGTALASLLQQSRLPDAQRRPVNLSLTALTPFDVLGDLTVSPGARITTDPLASVSLKAGLHLDLEGRIEAPGGKVALALVDSAVNATDRPSTGSLVVGSQASIDVSGRSILQPVTGLYPRGQVVDGGTVAISVAGQNARLSPIQVKAGAVLAADGVSDLLGVATTTADGGTALTERRVDSSGGSIAIGAREGGAALAGDLHARAGGSGASAGSFALTLAGVRNGSGSGTPVDLVSNYTIALQQAPVPEWAPVAGTVRLSAARLGEGFANVALSSLDRIRIVGDLNLALGGNLTLDAPLVTASPQSREVTLAAGGALLLGHAPIGDLPTATTAIGGNTALALQGGLVEFYGFQGFQGFASVLATAGDEVRFAGVQGSAQQGQLSLRADLTLRAPQVDVTSASDFTVDAPGQRVEIAGGDAARAAPLSAGGSLTINALDIALGDRSSGGSGTGVLRAPLGRIAFNAGNRIDIGSGSVVSVAGTGESVLFGSTVNGTNWSYNGHAVTAPTAKSVTLAGGTVNVAAGSTLDSSGGGKLLATEFVAGPGGLTDVFAGAAGGAYAVVPTVGGFAPQDFDTSSQKDSSGAVATVALGAQVTFGAGGPLPAGTYALLPARYALLDGAFLVRPVAATAPMELGATLARQDGSVLVGGQIGNAGAGARSNLPQTFQLTPSVLARTYSQINVSDADTYFAAQARAAGTDAPRLPQDAGRLDIAAQQIALKGKTLFAVPTTGSVSRGSGGELDIAADRIRIGTDGAAPAGTLALNVADLNATGAALLVLGGRRSVDGSQLTSGASMVTLDNAGVALKGADVVLVARDSLELKPGASVVATATGGNAASDELLNLTGDGALLRVSADAAAKTIRTGAARLTGDLSIGSGANLSGAALTAEATLSTQVAADAVFKASDITLGANRIAVGDLAGTAIAATTLAITPALSAQLGSGQALTLRSFDGIDLNGTSTLGDAGLQSLVIDTGSLRLLGSNASATIKAGGVTLVNTSGGGNQSTAGSGQLQVSATGAAGGTGQIIVGPGSLSVSGAAATNLAATQELVVTGQSSLQASGDLTIVASAVQADRQAGASLGAIGKLTIAANSQAPRADAGTGAHLALSGTSIEHSGRIELPSGQLALTATTGDVHLASSATNQLAGRDKTFDGVIVSTSGGDFQATARTGSVRIDTGAQVDVSAASPGGAAGSVGLAAAGGSVSIGGSLLGTSRAGQGGGRLSIDSSAPVDLDALQRTIAAGVAKLAGNPVDNSVGNFSEAISLRNRTGDQTLAGGPGFTAHHISLQSDAGSLAIAGVLDASGASGTSVVLAAGDTLSIGPGARITAHSTGPVGGEVQLMAGRVVQDADGNLQSNGQVLLNGGRIDASAGAGGAGGAGGVGGAAGRLLVRAQRTGDGQDVRVAKAAGAPGTVVSGATGVELEAVRQYQTELIDSDFIDQVVADNAGFAGAAGSNAARIVGRVGNLFSQAPTVQLRAGVEVVQTDPGLDLVMAGSDADHGWNLTRFDRLGQALAQPTGAPVNLTLRAAGNLLVQASISDGFLPAGTAPSSAAAATPITPSAVVAQAAGAYLDGGRIRLVGGADLGAANPVSTLASGDGGDVTIGNGGDLVVRSTTGAIQIASGRDVVLTDHQAVVYTTGTPIAGAGDVGVKAQAQSLLKAGSGAQSPTLTGGGSVSVSAQRDVSGAGGVDLDGQYVSEWLWRGADAITNGQASWWARYDRFQQGFATFGGGNMTVAAGRDVLNVEASAASSGYIGRDATGNLAGLQRHGGGDLSLTAARDISGGQVLEDAGTLTVGSGRDILAPVDAPAALQVLHGSSQVEIEARDNASVGLVTAFGLVRGAPQLFAAPVASTLIGAAAGATLRMVAAAGDLNYLGVATTDNGATAVSGTHASSTGIDKVIPDRSLFAAPGGNLALGDLIQVSGASTGLSVLAAKDATVATLTVAGTDARQSTPTLLVDDISAASVVNSPFGIGLTPFDLGSRDPVRIVSLNGDVAVTNAVNIVKPLRLLASRDVTFAQNVALQQQTADELSLVQAGRDVAFTFDNVPASLKVQGPGDLVVVAGRNIDLKTSGGLGATGNRENALLPASSATLTVLAGVTLGHGDYAGAVARYFPVLGGSGAADHAPDLVAQLDALAAGKPLPAVGSDAAVAFKSAAIADQIKRTQSLVGQTAFDAAVLADAQRRDASTNGPNIDLATATTKFQALADGDKSKVLGDALSTAWAALVPKAQQRQTVQAWLAQQGPAGSAADSNAAALIAFVAAQTGQPSLGLADALAAFDALAPERQAVLTDRVLFASIRNAGRAASALAGAERDAAYAKAYDALATVFPGAGTEGDLNMGSSQLRTYQGSAIDVLTPRGGVNVGQLASSTTPKSASVTGIVTGAGGDIRIAVRDDVNVNQSRIFTVGQGDLLIWSSKGNIDAGRGAKTVTGAPPPVFRFDANGNFVLDTSGSYSGSGIAVLNASSTLDLYAPVGEINAGDAGIKSLGNAFLGAARFVGADNLSVSGTAVGAPPPASVGGETAGLAAVGQSAVTAGTRIGPEDSEEEKDRKRRKRLNLILDFLGFGDGSGKT